MLLSGSQVTRLNTTLDYSWGGAKAEGRAAELCIQRKGRTRAGKKQIHRSFSETPMFPKIAVISVFIYEKGERVITEA